MQVNSHPHRRGLTLVEVIGVTILLVLVALIALVIIPPSSSHHGNRNTPKNSSQLRGIHMSAVIFAQSNNYHLPGLDSAGDILPDGPTTTGNSGDGSTVEARFWILLQGQFIPAEMLRNPQESLTAKWTSNAVVKANYSYAMLHIGSTNTDAGRVAEWKDNANSSAVMISDRNTGDSSADSDVQSLWTPTPGMWKGHLVWGDNHAELSTSHTGLKTRYGSTSNADDNIFRDDFTSHGSNALMVR